jgi:hypothetical protein
VFPYIAELADELPAHATRAGRRRDVGGDCDGAEIACFGSLESCQYRSSDKYEDVDVSLRAESQHCRSLHAQRMFQQGMLRSRHWRP